MTAFRPVTHVIFDCDGLLLDTDVLYERMYSDLAEMYGKEFTWEMQMMMLGMPDNYASEIFIEKLGLSITPADVISYLHRREKELFHNVSLMPGVDILVRHLVAHQIPIAIATSSSLESMELKMSDHKDLWSLFSHTVTSSDLAEIRLKPAPDMFLLCASRFTPAVLPEDCLVLEASPNGLLGALAAGMQVVMVPDPRIPEGKRPATHVVPSLEEFQPELFGLPAF